MTQKIECSITRKDFLKHGLALTAALTVPAFLLPGCSCGGGLPGSESSPPLHYASFELTSSKPMDAAAVLNALGVIPNDASFSGKTVAWSAGNTVFYCKLPYDSAGKTYTVTIGATAVDSVGNAIDGNSDGTGGDQYSFSVTSV